MSEGFNAAQQELADKIFALGKEDPDFRAQLEENEGETLREYGLLEEYAEAFGADVEGYVVPPAGSVGVEPGSTCCVSDISGDCCLSCWFTF